MQLKEWAVIKKIILALSFICLVFICLGLWFIYGAVYDNYIGKVVVWALNHSGHKADQISISGSSEKLDVQIKHLHMKDDIKDLEIQNLNLQVVFSDLQKSNSITSLEAESLSYRDLTRPNESLRQVLMQLKPAQQKQTCIQDLKIDHISFAVSASADPFLIKNLHGRHVCLSQDLTFESLTFQSEDFELQNEAILFSAKPGHFWDLEKPRQITFSLKPFLKTDEVF